MKRKIFFRADAGADIGYGHFVRTLALADILKEDFECVFVTQSPTEYQTSEVAKVCELIEVPASKEKFNLFLEMLSGNEIVVLDNYFYDTEYQRKIKNKGCKLVCIDDMHDKHYVADVLINHGLTNQALFSTEPYTRLCLGFEYALLRPAFFNIPFSVRNSQPPYREIVVGFGGADKYDLTGQVCGILKKIPGIKSITAIVGDSYASVCDDAKICFCKNLQAEDIVKIFTTVDLAILSASTMTLEALACGIPVAAGYYVDNQVEFYKELVHLSCIFPLENLLDVGLEKRITSFIGHSVTPFRMMTKGIKERYKDLFGSLFVRQNDVRENFEFVDYCHLSEAQHREVWEIRNKTEIRSWMTNSEPFSFETHLAFVERLKNSGDKMYWAVYLERQLVGSINIQWLGLQKAERGIFINPAFIGKHIAAGLEANGEEIFRQLGIRCLKAKILRNNIRSLKYHLKIGYMLVDEKEDFYYLSKKLND